MTDRQTLSDLLEKVRAAKVGSRELDRELHVLLHGWKLARVGADYDGENVCEVYTQDGKLIDGFAYPPRGRIDPYYHVPDWPSNQYTRNGDAALQLARFWSPMWVGPIHITSCGSAQVTFEAREPCDRRGVQVVGQTVALGLVEALLTALLAEEAGK